MRITSVSSNVHTPAPVLKLPLMTWNLNLCQSLLVHINLQSVNLAPETWGKCFCRDCIIKLCETEWAVCIVCLLFQISCAINVLFMRTWGHYQVTETPQMSVYSKYVTGCVWGRVTSQVPSMRYPPLFPLKYTLYIHLPFNLLLETNYALIMLLCWQ